MNCVKTIENYEFNLNSLLGTGSYSSVYLGKDNKTNQEVAVKTINSLNLQRDPNALNNLLSEIETMKQIIHPNTVQLYQAISNYNNYFIILEYCNQGDLEKFLKKKRYFKEDEAIYILNDIVNGYKEILKHNVIHRDIKPANIFIHNGCFKIGDFGFAKVVKNINELIQTEKAGTPLFASPQCLTNMPYSSKTDVWSLGIIFYEMITGNTPWPLCRTQGDLIRSVFNLPVKFPQFVSKICSDFIKGCLQINEKNRFSWEDVFSHEIFQNLHKNKFCSSQFFENKEKKNMKSKTLERKNSFTKKPKKFSVENQFNTMENRNIQTKEDFNKDKNLKNNQKIDKLNKVIEFNMNLLKICNSAKKLLDKNNWNFCDFWTQLDFFLTKHMLMMMLFIRKEKNLEKENPLFLEPKVDKLFQEIKLRFKDIRKKYNEKLELIKEINFDKIFNELFYCGYEEILFYNEKICKYIKKYIKEIEKNLDEIGFENEEDATLLLKILLDYLEICSNFADLKGNYQKIDKILNLNRIVDQGFNEVDQNFYNHIKNKMTKLDVY